MRQADDLPLDLNLLRSLHALLDQTHVSRAAAVVGLSQPAMSRVLARLRADFNDPLLVRGAGGFRRTPRAEALMEPLAAVLAQAEALYRGDVFDPASATRVFRAAMPDAVGAPLLAPLVAALAAEAPGCRLDVIAWPSAREALVANLDFAISTDFDLFPGFSAAPLFEDRDVLAMRPRELSSGWRGRIEAMLAEPHIAVVPADKREDPVDRWLARTGATRRIGAVVPHYLQALLLASQSDLVTILPSRLVAATAEAFGLVAVELPVEPEPDRHYLFHPAERDADPASRWIRALVTRVVGA